MLALLGKELSVFNRRFISAIIYWIESSQEKSAIYYIRRRAIAQTVADSHGNDRESSPGQFM
jgi:hypothetical protein